MNQVEHAAKTEEQSRRAGHAPPAGAAAELLRLSLRYGIASTAASFVAVQRRADGSKLVCSPLVGLGAESNQLCLVSVFWLFKCIHVRMCVCHAC